MSPFFILLLLRFTFHGHVDAKHEKKLVPAVVVGTAFCDTCFQEDFSKSIHFIPGASIAVECRDGNSRLSFRREVTTDENGEFRVHLPFSVPKHARKIRECNVKLIRSSEPNCAVASMAASSLLLLKSRKEGTHIFSAGFFTFKPQKQPKQCSQEKSLKISRKLDSQKTSFPLISDPTFPPPVEDPRMPDSPPLVQIFLPPLPLIATLPPLPKLPPLPPLPLIPTQPPLPTFPPLPPPPPIPTQPPLPTFPPLPPFPLIPTLPPLPKLPPLPPLPGLPNLPSMPGNAAETKASADKLPNPELLIPTPPQFPLNSFQQPPILPPNSFHNLLLRPPPPFQPPSHIPLTLSSLPPPLAPLIPLPPNSLQPPPAPLIPLPSGPFQPPSAPLIPLPPMPGLTPPPDFSFPPSGPGIPTASSSSSKTSSP